VSSGHYTWRAAARGLPLLVSGSSPVREIAAPRRRVIGDLRDTAQVLALNLLPPTPTPIR
jgi:hypothetical protein